MVLRRHRLASVFTVWSFWPALLSILFFYLLFAAQLTVLDSLFAPKILLLVSGSSIASFCDSFTASVSRAKSPSRLSSPPDASTECTFLGEFSVRFESADFAPSTSLSLRHRRPHFPGGKFGCFAPPSAFLCRWVRIPYHSPVAWG